VGARCRGPRHVPTDPACPPRLIPSRPPWLPPRAAKAPLNPRVPCLEEGTDLRVPQVSLPPEELAAPLLGHALSAPAPGALGDLPPSPLEPFDRFRAATPPQVPAGNAAAAKGPLPRPPHGPLGLGDLELKPGGPESAQAPSPPGSCPVAPPLHVAILRVSYEPRPSPLHLPVAPVSEQVGP
jgi:hypothetical protein